MQDLGEVSHGSDSQLRARKDEKKGPDSTWWMSSLPC